MATVLVVIINETEMKAPGLVESCEITSRNYKVTDCKDGGSIKFNST